MEKSKVLFGRIGRRKGLKGEYFFDMFTPYPESLENIFLEDNPDNFNENSPQIDIDYLKRGSKRFVIKFKEETDELTGKFLSIKKWKLDDGSFWIDDLSECDVVDSGGNFLGNVCEIDKNMPQTWVKIKKDGRKFSFPFVKDIVENVSLEKKQIVIKVFNHTFLRVE